MDSKAFIDILAKKTSFSKKETSEIAEAIGAAIKEYCVEGDAVAIPGFGTFETRKKNERVMTVPSSGGKRLLIPPKIVVGFKPSSILKQRLQDNNRD